MAYFAFKGSESKEFIFELTDTERITEAREILSTGSRMHVMGRIKKQQKPYNPDWDYHLDPATIRFFEVAIEVCDATMTYLNDHLDEACGAFLPGCIWCPWDSRLQREVTA
jgi:hypothetical protein